VADGEKRIVGARMSEGVGGSADRVYGRRRGGVVVVVVVVGMSRWWRVKGRQR
jgi:hypothetical protein